MKEPFITSIGAMGAGFVTTLFGGWDRSLEVLLIFIVLDYLSGVAAAIKSKTLKSSVGYEGLIKKAVIFLIVILAAQLDRITGNPAGLFRTATAFFFMANEGLSILENVGELGVKLPGFIKNVLVKLRDDNDNMSTDDSKEDTENGDH